MALDYRETKERFIQALYSRGCYCRKVNDVEYVTRCPFCGDSRSNPHIGKLYIKIDLDHEYSMVYHCFKCDESGIVNSDFLETIGFEDIELKSGIAMLNKNSDNPNKIKYLYGDMIARFNFELPKVSIGDKTKYIENRLGRSFSIEEYSDMKVITSLAEFLKFNNIEEVTMSNSLLLKLEKNYVGFLSFGGSHIFFRDITEKEEFKWIKYPILEKSKACKAFYSMSAAVDVYTKDEITINLSEGILDTLSVYGNLGFSNSNTMNISVGGKGYLSILSILLNMGFVGDNVKINIFSDNDEEFNENGKGNTDLHFFKKLFEKRKKIYGSVDIWYNTISKDFGVPKDQISTKKYRL